MCRDVPPELHPLIRSFEPYPKGNGYSGGDEQLRHLGRVSNPNKHNVALRIQPVIQGPIEMAITTTVSGALRPIKPAWNAAKTKLALFELVKSTDYYFNVEAGADIVFADAAIEGVSVHGFFKVQLLKVESILDRLEAETRRIIAARS